MIVFCHRFPLFLLKFIKFLSEFTSRTGHFLESTKCKNVCQMVTFAVPRGELVFREEVCSPFPNFGLSKTYGRLTFVTSSLSLRKLVENFANSSQNGWFASLDLHIRSTSMALPICLVSALVWSVERMVPGWISYFDLRLRSGRLPFPDCKATHAASLKPIISPWSPWQTSRT